MNVLAERVLLSRSGITRLVDRLEAQGCVERIACETDARGQEALLTSAGLDRLRPAAATHLDGIRRYFLDRLEPAELAALESALGRVAAPLGPDSRPPRGMPARQGLTGPWPRWRPVTAGRLRTGTSGFAYPAWSPRFYPAGLRGRGSASPLRLAPRDGRAEQHLLPHADGRPRSTAGWPRPRTTSGSPSRPRRAARGGRSGWIRARASRG